MLAADLTHAQLESYSTIERVSSGLSLLGSTFVVLTFLITPHFHKPINRLIFYACVGNYFTNIATIISRHPIITGNLNGPICQAQAFLIQMFLPADTLWTFAMAMNVYLTFYWGYGARELRRLEYWYMLFCFGIPFVPALVFCFIQSADKGKMYGNATLWCWISSEWDVYRIACFYAPIWAVIALTIAIYVRAGRDIYIKNKQLREFSRNTPSTIQHVHDPFTSNPDDKVVVVVTKETDVVMDQSTDGINLSQMSSLDGMQKPGQLVNSYKAVISTGDAANDDPRYSTERKDSSAEVTLPSSSDVTNLEAAPNTQTRNFAAREANSAIMSYTRVALFFFLAMMVTWIPSSANRLYSVIHEKEVNAALLALSSLVLPLQGFWNACIYVMTSKAACKYLWKDMRNFRRGILTGNSVRTNIAAAFQESPEERAPYTHQRSPPRMGISFHGDTESTEELQEDNRPRTPVAIHSKRFSGRRDMPRKESGYLTDGYGRAITP